RLESEKTDGERVYRIVARRGFRRCHGCAECVAMRGRSTDPAAIEAEIAHLRSLALDALRRHWRVIFGRPLPAENLRENANLHQGWQAAPVGSDQRDPFGLGAEHSDGSGLPAGL